MLPWLKPGQSDNKKVSLKLFIFENYSTEKYSEKQESVKKFKVWQSNSGYFVILTRIPNKAWLENFSKTQIFDPKESKFSKKRIKKIFVK